MLPLRDRTPTTHLPWVTIGLIAANLAVFLLWQPTFGTEDQQRLFYACHGAIPWEARHAENLANGGEPARLAIDDDQGLGLGKPVQQALQRTCPDKSWWISSGLRCSFTAGGSTCSATSSSSPCSGLPSKDARGPLPFLLLYLAGGLIASALQILLSGSSTVPTIGASGAIGAVLGTYLALFPRHRIVTLVFAVALVELPAILVLGTWFVLQLFSGVAGIGNDLGSGTAYWAHVGGFLAGVGAAFLVFGAGTSRTVPSPPRPDA